MQCPRAASLPSEPGQPALPCPQSLPDPPSSASLVLRRQVCALCLLRLAFGVHRPYPCHLGLYFIIIGVKLNFTLLGIVKSIILRACHHSHMSFELIDSVFWVASCLWGRVTRPCTWACQ